MKEGELYRRCSACGGEGYVWDPSEYIGRKMRETRKARGIGLRQMARRVRCSAPYLSDVERGNRKIGEPAIRAMVVLGMTEELGWIQCRSQSAGGEG